MQSVVSKSYPFLPGGGEMGELTRNFDWSKTPLGMPDQWPQSLRTALSILLNSKFPMFLFWGRDLICFYNDAYRPSLGKQGEGKHPDALGKKGEDVWPEIWPIIKPLIDQVLSGGEATWSENQLIPIYRNGHLEDVYWTFSYSPVRDESGMPSGVFVTCEETTGQIATIHKLEESEEKYRSLFQSMDQGFCVFEMLFDEAGQPVDYRFQEINPAFEAQTGLINAVGKTAKEMVPSLEKHWLELYGKVAVTGESTRFMQGSDAMGRWFDVHAYRTGKAEERKVALLFTNITEQRLAEEKATLSINAAELGTFEIDLLNNKVITSPRFDAIFDMNASSEHDEYVSRLVKEDLPIREAAYETARTTGKLEYEVRVKWKDGSIHWVRAKGFMSFDPTNQPVKLIGVVQDVTEHKRFAEELQKQVIVRTAELEAARASLLEANNYLQNIINKFDTALASLVPVYDNGKIVDFYFKMTNLAYKAYSDLSPEQIQNKLVSDVFPGYYQTEAFEKYIETFTTGKGNHWQLHYNQDGLDVHLQVSVDKTGEELVINFTDFTTLKNLQLALQDKVEELERSNDELQQFAHVASHDLKEPVRKIRTFGSRMKMEFENVLPEKAKMYLDKMESAAARIYAMIDGVLLYSSLNALKQTSEQVDLNMIIKQIQEDLEVIIQQKNAVITGDTLPVIEGSSVLLYQLFYNLLNNSLKFTKAGHAPYIQIQAELSPSTRLPDNKKQYVIIRVADNGIGFEKGESEKIFETFVRLNSKDKFEGTGLGLALCHKIVERHGGSIIAEGKENEGAVFTIALPLTQI